MTRWFLQHTRTGYWLADDPTEPNGRTWRDTPAQALQAVDPDALAARLRQSLPIDLLEGCRMVPVASCSTRRRGPGP
jgi:hypothetical protein